MGSVLLLVLPLVEVDEIDRSGAKDEQQTNRLEALLKLKLFNFVGGLRQALA
jgi:hypothetical protein